MTNDHWDPENLPSQAGKTFVVTGGNAGIGYFISEQLAGAGARIILASRSEQKAEVAAASIRKYAPGATVDFVRLDLTSLASIRDAAGAIQKLGPIDGLINNAGITTGGRERKVTQDGLELIIGANAFGPFALTALALQALAPHGRVISQTSQATQVVKLDPGNLQSEHGTFSFFRAYGYSKHAVLAFAFELQRRLTAADSTVESLLAHPGIAIDLKSPRRPGIIDRGRPSDYITALYAQGKDRGAWPAVRAATDPNATGGDYYGPRRRVAGPAVRIEATAPSANEEFGEEFWRQAEDATGIAFDLRA
ncbi:SDR family NAD(P)-dependent oxidoreductase [Streptosporangium sp. NPDC051022]|uniref:SDR family NAD(P)-dependent oxidoreductase n=1 Tax=Streptosporangium sp. NPDC051022 TaxID=3155752 RepID=UPI00341C77BF